MDTPSPLVLASLVLTAPGWVRVGAAAPDPRTREVAALELGAILAGHLDRPLAIAREGQTALPLEAGGRLTDDLSPTSTGSIR